MGAVIVSDRIAEPFLDGANSFTHGFTFGGHPMCAAVALANLDALEREGVIENVRAHEGDVPRDARVAARPPDRRRRARRRLLPRDRAGQGQGHQGVVLRRRSPRRCCAASCPASCTAAGLICRADDRGDPVIQLSPPLIAGPEQFAEIESILRPVLTEAGERMHVHTTADGAARRCSPFETCLATSTSACWRARQGSSCRFAGSTSPSCSTRRRGCPAARCC